jgi:Zn-dependent M28 family amino/carboxypeptidase
MKAQKSRIYDDINFLTSLRPFRNYRNKGSLEKTVFYIREEFIKANSYPSLQSWHVCDEEYHNVIAVYNPEKSPRLILGAHYDVFGDQPGADDNASAVAGLLEVSRMVFETLPQLDYRIDFVAYCLEEPPFFASEKMGSYVHAKSLYENNVEVIGMICLEMIGYFSDEPNSQAFPFPELASIYPHTANFIIVVGINRFLSFNTRVHQLMSEDAEIDVQVIQFPSSEGLAGLSDQRNYWQFGYPALMINDTSFIRNPHYHQSSDTIETLDLDKLTEVVNCTYKAVTGIL